MTKEVLINWIKKNKIIRDWIIVAQTTMFDDSFIEISSDLIKSNVKLIINHIETSNHVDKKQLLEFFMKSQENVKEFADENEKKPIKSEEDFQKIIEEIHLEIEQKKIQQKEEIDKESKHLLFKKIYPSKEIYFIEHEWDSIEILEDFIDNDYHGGKEFAFDYNYDIIGSKVLSPFVFKIDGGTYNEPYRWEILQDFILFYNTFYDREKNEYYTYDNDDYEKEKCIKIIEKENDYQILVKSYYLRHFLRETDNFLLRQIYKDKYSNVSVKEEEKEIIFSDSGKNINNYHYTIYSNLNTEYKEFNSLSRMFGKEIILPYKEKKNRKNYAKFPIGINEYGEEKEISCENKIIRPIFFKKKVLKKYFESDKYNIRNQTIFRLGLWSIQYNINNEIVNVYLKDLGFLPYSEQKHWRLFAIVPNSDSKMSRGQIARDFYAKFADPSLENNPIYHIKSKFKSIQENFQEKFSSPLFINLHPDDEYIIKKLKIPLTDNQREFDTDLMLFAKVFCGSINVKFLKKELKAFLNSDDNLRSINLFKMFIEKKFTKDENELDKIFQPFFNIWYLRSSSSGHLKGKKYEKNLERYGIESNSAGFKRLIIELYQSLNKLNEILNN